MDHMVTLEILKNAIRTIPDFPKPGIRFRDITTVLKQPDLFKFTVDTCTDYYDRKGITKVVGIESRGFIIGGALACRLEAGFVPVRKAGKLPAEVFQKTYVLEYGKDTLEIHQDALSKTDTVLLHDDLMATGGTALAVIDLIRKAGVRKIYCNFIIELDFLQGRKKLTPDYEVFSLIHFNA